MRPIIEAHKYEGDLLRHVPDAILDAFYERSMFRVQLPVEKGGSGLTLPQWLALIEEVASYDGSTGWTYAPGSVVSIVNRIFPAEVADEVLADARPYVCQSTSSMPGVLLIAL